MTNTRTEDVEAAVARFLNWKGQDARLSLRGSDDGGSAGACKRSKKEDSCIHGGGYSFDYRRSSGAVRKMARTRSGSALENIGARRERGLVQAVVDKAKEHRGACLSASASLPTALEKPPERKV